MNRAAQIAWWVAQVEAPRTAVGVAAQSRRQPRSFGGLEEEPRARAARVAPLAKVPPAHEVIRGQTITGGRDEERSRSLPGSSAGGGGGGATSPCPSAPAPIAGGLSGGGQGAAGRARQLASGYQPAVVKVLSWAHGTVRATKTGQYAQREDVPLETHDGRMLTDREAVADEIKAWSVNFSKRAESQDVGAVRLSLRGVKDSEEGRETYEKAVAAGFAGHRYVYRLDTTELGELEARLVIALAGPAKERFRVRQERVGDREHGFARKRFDMASERKIKDRIHAATGVDTQAIDASPGMTNHGRKRATFLPIPASCTTFTTSATSLYASGISSSMVARLAARTRIPWASSSRGRLRGRASRLAWCRLSRRPAPWHDEPNVRVMAASVPTSTKE